MNIRASISVDDAIGGNYEYTAVATSILNECINEACSKIESRLKREIPKIEFFISADPA